MLLRVTNEDKIFLLQLSNSLRETESIPMVNPDKPNGLEPHIMITKAAAEQISDRIDNILGVERKEGPVHSR